MPRDSGATGSVIDEIFALKPNEVADFINRCRRERRLSEIIQELNADVLNPLSPRKADAEAALERMGFI